MAKTSGPKPQAGGPRSVEAGAGADDEKEVRAGGGDPKDVPDTTESEESG